MLCLTSQINLTRLKQPNMKHKFDQSLLDSYFLINRDEQELFNRVKQGDQVALIQLCVTHMPFIKSCLNPLPFDNSKNYNVPKSSLMYIAMQGFINAVYEHTSLLAGGSEEVAEFPPHREIRKAIEAKLADEVSNYKRRTHSKKQIAKLNKINKLLIEKEKKILERVDELLKQGIERTKNDLTFTSDHMLDVEVQYYIPSNDNPSHTYWSSFCFKDLSDKEFRDELLGDGKNHDEYGFPVLENPYCYLLHDLLDHSHLGQKVYDINMIWIDIVMYNQEGIDIHSNGDSYTLKYDEKTKSFT